MTELRVCVICGEPFKLRQASRPKQQTCGLVCRQKLLARRSRPGLVGQRSKPREPTNLERLRIRVRIHLDDERCGEDRRGFITRERRVAGRPLYTVRLDKGGWPGGCSGREASGGWAGWYVELRPEEVELLR